MKNADKQSVKRRGEKKKNKWTTPETDTGYFFWKGASLELGKEKKVPVFAGIRMHLCFTLSKAHSFTPCIAAGPVPPFLGLGGLRHRTGVNPKMLSGAETEHE